MLGKGRDRRRGFPGYWGWGGRQGALIGAGRAGAGWKRLHHEAGGQIMNVFERMVQRENKLWLLCITATDALLLSWQGRVVDQCHRRWVILGWM